jgi:hypothetical protein
MLLIGTAQRWLLIAHLTQAPADTRPPFWWIGLFASTGGLLIIGECLAVIVLLGFVVKRLFR